MARRSRSRRRYERVAPVQRYRPSVPRTARPPVSFVRPLRYQVRPLVLLDPLLDRRTFHPDGVTMRPLTSSFGPPGGMRDVNKARGKGTSNRYLRPTYGARVFGGVQKVAVCVRRNVRRQVLFAHGVGGGSTRRLRRRVRSSTSDVRC